MRKVQQTAGQSILQSRAGSELGKMDPQWRMMDSALIRRSIPSAPNFMKRLVAENSARAFRLCKRASADRRGREAVESRPAISPKAARAAASQMSVFSSKKAIAGLPAPLSAQTVERSAAHRKSDKKAPATIT